MAQKSSRARAVSATAAFKLLSDENRDKAVKLVMASRTGLLVGDIADALDMGQSATSHLLSLLLKDEVVKFKKEGRTVRYMLAATPAAKRVIRLLKAA